MGYLTNRYLDYFRGCANHFNNENVLFSSVEELSLDQENAFSALTRFLETEKILPPKRVQFLKNVHSAEIKSSILFEFEDLITIELQEQILEKTAMAAKFFATAKLQRKYKKTWEMLELNIVDFLLSKGIKENSVVIDNRYFEPFTYVLRNPGVLQRNVDPIQHFRKKNNFVIN